MTAKEYLEKMSEACSGKINLIYHTKKDHITFARECGYALNGFSEKEQREILQCSYGKIYVKGCALKPLLDAKEWAAAMLEGKNSVKK